MQLLTLQESIDLSTKDFGGYYSRYINPGLFKIYKLLGLSDMDIESASGVEIFLKDGRRILDFSSAIGILALGHNHPRIIAAEKLCHDKQLIDAIKVAPHKLQAALAYNLSQLLPDPLRISFFCVSGAEAVEGAMKLCEKIQGSNKTKFITTKNSYHGKTHGALSVTTSGGFKNGFLMGIPENKVIAIQYGNIEELERVIKENETTRNNNSIIAVILEPIQGQGIVVPSPGYLKKVVEICRKSNILVIFDEIKAGMGRTGKFCSFQHENVVPDVVTLSKAMGGGKRAISAFVTTDMLFKKAYGKRKDAGLHSTTFGGLGESCAVAIETLNVLVEEKLMEQAIEKGDYLKGKLEHLKSKHSDKVKNINGRGLLLGIQFQYDKHVLRRLMAPISTTLVNTMDSILIASIVRELYEKHNIIVHFSNSDLDTLHIMPPLVVEYHHLDRLYKALDEMLHNSFSAIVSKFVRANVLS